MSNENGPLQILEENVALPPHKKNVFRHHFIEHDGEVVVHLSNFTDKAKYFNILVEEITAEGKAVSAPAPEEKVDESGATNDRVE